MFKNNDNSARGVEIINIHTYESVQISIFYLKQKNNAEIHFSVNKNKYVVRASYILEKVLYLLFWIV